jgi:hypothetical protein
MNLVELDGTFAYSFCGPGASRTDSVGWLSLLQNQLRLLGSGLE